jgi:hypothetical protein
MLNFDINKLEFHYKFYEESFNRQLMYFYTILGFDLLNTSDRMVIEFYIQIHKKINIIDKLNLKKLSEEQIRFFIDNIYKNKYFMIEDKKYLIKDIIIEIDRDFFTIDYCANVIFHKWYYCR